MTKRRILDPYKFYEGSFADEKISKMEFDVKNKRIKIFIDGCESDDDSGKQLFYKFLILEINGWWDLKIFMNNAQLNIEKIVSCNEFDPLDEILIYHISKDSLILEGYGKLTNQWLKFVFIRPKINLSGVDRTCPLN